MRQLLANHCCRGKAIIIINERTDITNEEEVSIFTFPLQNTVTAISDVNCGPKYTIARNNGLTFSSQLGLNYFENK